MSQVHFSGADRAVTHVAGRLEREESGVWVPLERRDFHYSDGLSSERYLEKVLARAQDLSSGSDELEPGIRDWPSEYHLSRRRANLLRGFTFGPKVSVLEVGCGCGAITRFLGETFESVIAVEGSLPRARLARLRTRDLQSVEVISAPLQDLAFDAPFDLIFCIGVFEYAGLLGEGSDPHDAMLRRLRDALAPGGALILAIENQFGLKYFASSREDHTGVMFDGVEGYPRRSNKARTFGYDELRDRLAKYFPNIQFYFAYPDYKLPSCVLAERFFTKANLGELVGRFRSRDYLGDLKPLFDERLALLELDRNHKLPFVANSFLVVAGASDVLPITFPWLGVLYSTRRVKTFETVTRFVEREDASIWVEKSLQNGQRCVEVGGLSLRATMSQWVDGLSLHMQLLQRVKATPPTLEELFAPCRVWLDALLAGGMRSADGVLVKGAYVDCIWENSYVRDGRCVFVDQEWQLHDSLPLNVLVIRSVHEFLKNMRFLHGVTPALVRQGPKSAIAAVARSLGLQLRQSDFEAFYELDANIAEAVFGVPRGRHRRALRLAFEAPWVAALVGPVARSGRAVAATMARVRARLEERLLRW